MGIDMHTHTHTHTCSCLQFAKSIEELLESPETIETWSVLTHTHTAQPRILNNAKIYYTIFSTENFPIYDTSKHDTVLMFLQDNFITVHVFPLTSPPPISLYIP